jgi:Protein of unknown function (DUF1254)
VAATPNPDVIYGLGFIDLKDGPLVFDAPPQMQGLLDDFWHRPLTDIGAAGPEQGKGGKLPAKRGFPTSASTHPPKHTSTGRGFCRTSRK